MTTAVHDRLISNFDTQPINANSTTLEERVNALAPNDIMQAVDTYKEVFLAYNIAAFKRNCSLVVKTFAFATFMFGATGMVNPVIAGTSFIICLIAEKIFIANKHPIVAGTLKSHKILVSKLDADPSRQADEVFVELEPLANYIRECINRKDKTFLGGYFYKYFSFNKEEQLPKLVHPLYKLIPTMYEREFNKIKEIQ
ncbi:MAG: hypothetical protein PVI40_06215 [Chlamydiota bacterium]|jgi:hypothetical protein